MENKISIAKGRDKTVYLLGLSPTLVNDLQCIADDNNEPLQEVIFCALTLYTQLCEEVKKGRKIGAFDDNQQILLEYEGFYK